MPRSEDWWSVLVGFALIAACAAGWVGQVPAPARWVADPLESLRDPIAWALLVSGLAVITGLAACSLGHSIKSYIFGFLGVFALSTLARLLGAQHELNAVGLGYALWALALGLLISNTVGTPRWLETGARSELFIRIGLVLLGAELLVSRVFELGGPGLVVAYGVTPVIIVGMWLLGTKMLRMSSKSLTIIIACATSVCGVSAAVATAAAVRAKKEELTLAIGLTMIFTVAMMVGMPALCRLMGLDGFVSGAWIGGTVDSTGAVVVAGAMLGEQAEQVAAIVKMIQNTMIGFIAFVIALYWVARVEPQGARPTARTLWDRFPKFVLGFLAASAVASFVFVPWLGDDGAQSVAKATKGFRGWFFAMAFVAIGLESNFRKLAAQLRGGKPIVLYALGQSANIVLTLLVASLAFSGFNQP